MESAQYGGHERVRNRVDHNRFLHIYAAFWAQLSSGYAGGVDSWVYRGRYYWRRPQYCRTVQHLLAEVKSYHDCVLHSIFDDSFSCIIFLT